MYTIDPGCGGPFKVYCDMQWSGQYIVFQRRRDGSENFYRGWNDYVNGFGDLKREFWIGLNKLHCLTSAAPRVELKIDLSDFEGNYKYAQYSFFSVGNSATKYRLNIAGYTGTAGDDMIASHNLNGRPFTTKDHDNDHYRYNCAVEYQAAWWYNDCTWSSLNGLYRSGEATKRGVYWHLFKNSQYSLKFAQMKLRFR